MTIRKALHDKYIRTVFSDNDAGPKELFLWPLTVASYIYGAVMSIRYRCYRTGVFPSQKLSIPVISVGNISIGGTGKTPTTLFLTNFLRKEGKRVVVVSRGYRGTADRRINIISDGSNILLKAQEAGDEPFLMANRLPGVPVLTGRNRAHVGMCAQKDFAAQVVVLDDGFQHLRLKRDVDIVLLDQKRPFANGHLLPRGPLREPPQSLCRAHIALVTLPQGGTQRNRQDIERRIHSYNPEIPIFFAYYIPTAVTTLSGNEKTPLDVLKGKKVVALAGVGRPGSFAALLERLGAQVVETRFFPDHHKYRLDDLNNDHPNATIVTTEKDAVKLKSLKIKNKNVLVLIITLKLDQERLFFASLKKCLPSLF